MKFLKDLFTNFNTKKDEENFEPIKMDVEHLKTEITDRKYLTKRFFKLTVDNEEYKLNLYRWFYNPVEGSVSIDHMYELHKNDKKICSLGVSYRLNKSHPFYSNGKLIKGTIDEDIASQREEYYDNKEAERIIKTAIAIIRKTDENEILKIGKENYAKFDKRLFLVNEMAFKCKEIE